MLEVICKKENGTYKEFIMKGHTYFADKGSDIVCSAVSILFLNTMNSIETFTEDRPMVSTTGKGESQVCTARLATVSKESKLLLDAMMLGLDGIEKNYKKNLSIKIEEEMLC